MTIIRILSFPDPKLRRKGIPVTDFGEATQKIIDELTLSKSIALVSDAGMPGICDPGEDLIKEAKSKGLKISRSQNIKIPNHLILICKSGGDLPSIVPGSSERSTFAFRAAY